MGDNERLAKVEMAVEAIGKGLTRMETKLDNLLDNLDKRFLSRAEGNEIIRRLEAKQLEQDDEIKDLKNKSAKVVAGLVTLVITIIGAVAQAYLTK